jgi:FkbM family methyltransferase
MKILGQNIKLGDFIPPIIFNKIYKKPETKLFISSKLGSYSQYNEDLYLDLIFKCKSDGFYVDIGANDPSILSNTKRFYDRGWKGVNVEPNPTLHAKLQNHRPNDVNLNVGVGSSRGSLPFYIMSADTLSSFDKEAAFAGGKVHGAHLEKVLAVELVTLAEIFATYAPAEIDFLSVDTEGYDLQVLQSNDWSKWRPKALVVETAFHDDRVDKYLITIGYERVFDNSCNSIYLDTGAAV